MKRIFVGALAMLTVLLMLLPAGAASAATTTSSAQITIEEKADYDFVGGTIDVGLRIKCTGGSGSVIVDLEQYPPETPYPVATGSGPQIVVCDGQPRTVGVTVAGFGFDAGKAYATATLTTDDLQTVTEARRITIRVV